MSVSSVGGGSSAALEAQRQAEIARERAEAARRAAERAREAARRAAEAAAAQAKAAAAARAKAAEAQQNLSAMKAKGDSGPKVDKAEKDATKFAAAAAQAEQKAQKAAERVKTLQDKATVAQKTLDQNEVKVVLQGTDAEKQMRAANLAAGAAGQVPFSEQQIASAGPSAKEVRDGFDGITGRRRDDMAAKLGFTPASDPNQIAGQLEADRGYAKLCQDPGGRMQLDALKIRNGNDLRAFGARLERQALAGGPARATDAPLNSADPASLAKVIQAAGQTLGDQGKQILTDPTFASLAARGADPRTVASAVGAAQQVASASNAGPLDGAEALVSQLGKSADPVYRQALVQAAMPSIKSIGEKSAGDGKPDSKVMQQIADDLAKAGNLVGLDGSRAMAKTLAPYLDDNKLGYDKTLNGKPVFNPENLDGALANSAVNGQGDVLFRSVPAAQQAIGKADSANWEVQKSEGGLSGFVHSVAGFVGGAAGDVFNGIKDGAKAAWGLGADVTHDVVDKGLDFANQGLKTAGDLARLPEQVALSGADKLLQGAEAIAPDSVDNILEKGRDVVHVGQKVLTVEDQVQDGMTDAVTGLGKGANDLRTAAMKDPVGTAEKTYEVARDAVDIMRLEHHIDDLGPGDSYKMQARLEGSIASVDGQLQGTMTVSKGQNGKYTLAVDGQVGAGVAARLGASGAASGEASVTGNVGAKVEFEFDNAHDAAEAARTFMGPVGGAVSGLVDNGPAGAVDGAIPHLDKLKPSAIELHGGAAAEVAGSLGFKGLGLDASASANANLSARIEFNHAGPPQIVLTESLSVKANASAGAGPVSASAGGQVTVAMQERFTLPSNVNAKDLVTDPGKVVRSLGDQVMKGDTTLSLTGKASAQANAYVSAGGELDAKLSFTGKTGDIVNSGAVQRALKGDFGGALDKLDGIVTVSGDVHTAVVSGPDFDIGGGDGVDSVKVGMTAQTTDVQRQLVSFDGKPLGEVRSEMGALIRERHLNLPLLG